MIIDQLPELTNTFDTDEIPIERGTNTYKTKISTFFSGLRDLIAARVSKSGDTMTGSLGIKSSNISPNNLPPSGNLFGNVRTNVYDADGNQVGYLTAIIDSNGNEGVVLVARRVNGNATNTTRLALKISSSGAVIVDMGNPNSWLSELGRATAVSYTVVSNIISSTVAGYTVTAAALKIWGKVAQIAIGVKASRTGTVTGKTVCTLQDIALPSGTTSAICENPDFTTAYISTTGNLVVTGDFASTSTTYYFRATYILA